MMLEFIFKINWIIWKYQEIKVKIDISLQKNILFWLADIIHCKNHNKTIVKLKQSESNYTNNI